MLRLLVFAVALTAGSAVVADEPPPVQLGALVRGFAIPAQGRPEILAAATWRQRIDLEDVNEYAATSKGTESLLLDGEATQLSYNLRYGWVERWEVGLFVPFLVQGGGILDPVIQDWHRLWGLPNGGRQYSPNDRYLYRYMRDGQTLVDVSRSTASFGDTQLTSGYQVADHFAARAMLKLPTGSASNLSGNGTVGGAVWLDGGLPLKGAFRWLTFYASLGYSLNGRGDILPRQQNKALPFGGAGFRIGFSERWEARLQMYFNAPAYRDSGLSPLSHIAVPLTATASYRLAPKTTVSFGFQEKAIFLASPDFGLHIGMAFDSR